MEILIKIVQIYVAICLSVLIITVTKMVQCTHYRKFMWYVREINWKNIALAPFLLLYMIWEDL